MSSGQPEGWGQERMKPTHPERETGPRRKEQILVRSKGNQWALRSWSLNISRHIATFKSRQVTLEMSAIGSGPSRSTEVTKAENYSRESLKDSSTSFSVVNLHGASSASGALFVAVIALACFGYGVAKYRTG